MALKLTKDDQAKKCLPPILYRIQNFACKRSSRNTHVYRKRCNPLRPIEATFSWDRWRLFWIWKSSFRQDWLQFTFTSNCYFDLSQSRFVFQPWKRQEVKQFQWKLVLYILEPKGTYSFFFSCVWVKQVVILHIWGLPDPVIWKKLFRLSTLVLLGIKIW